MSNQVQIFKRGQVWYVNDDAKSVGSIQAKSRPYLVVSNDSCNQYSPVIHMAPITSQDKKDLPTHVTVIDPYRKDTQTILLEQVMPKSIPDIISKSTYKYTLSEEKMKEVDKALTVQFGIKNDFVSLDDFEVALDMLVQAKLSDIKQEVNKYTDSKASSYVDKVLEVIDKRINSDIIIHKVSEPDKSNAQVAAPSITEVSDINTIVPTATIKPSDNKSSKIKWSEDSKKAFLADVDNKQMPREAILSKYGMTLSTMHSTAYRFRKELGISPRRNSNVTTVTSEQMNKARRYLDNYNSKPISEIVTMYKLSSKEKAVELANKYRVMLGE